jgi:hypothetical protein
MVSDGESFHQGRSLVMGPGKELGPWMYMAVYLPVGANGVWVKADGDRLIILEVGLVEINPKVNRISALRPKATGNEWLGQWTISIRHFRFSATSPSN